MRVFSVLGYKLNIVIAAIFLLPCNEITQAVADSGKGNKGWYSPDDFLSKVKPSFENGLAQNTYYDTEDLVGWHSDQLIGQHSLVWSGSSWSVETTLSNPRFEFLSSNQSTETEEVEKEAEKFFLEMAFPDGLNFIKQYNASGTLVNQEYLTQTKKKSVFSVIKVSPEEIVIVGNPPQSDASMHSFLMCPRKVVRGKRGLELIDSTFKLTGVQSSFQATAKAYLKTVDAVGAGQGSISVSNNLAPGKQFRAEVKTDSPRIDLEYLPNNSKLDQSKADPFRGAIKATAELIAPNGLKQVQESESFYEVAPYELKVPIKFRYNDIFFSLTGTGCYVTFYGTRSRQLLSQVEAPKPD